MAKWRKDRPHRTGRHGKKSRRGRTGPRSDHASRGQLRIEPLEARRVLSVANAAIDTHQEQVLADGLTGLSGWADLLDDHDLASVSLPVVGRSLGDALNLGDILDQGLAQPVAAYFAGDPTDPTTDELVTALQNLDTLTFDNVTLTVSNVSGGKSTVPGENELVFHIEFRADRSLTVDANLGPDGDLLGIDLDSTLPADAAATFQFSFGVDLSSGLSDQEAFFIRPGSLDWELTGQSSSLASAPMRLGFWDATLTSGNMDLDADVGITIHNPDLDAAGNVTLAELQGTPLSSLVSLQGSGTASGSIAATPGSLGGYTPTGSPALSFTSSDPFTAPALVVNSDFMQVQPLTNVSGYSYLGVLEQLAAWLDELQASALLDESVELVAGGRVGDLVDLKELFTQGLIDKLVDPEGRPTFNSAQSLAAELANVLGLPAATIAAQYQPTTKELTYHLRIQEALAAQPHALGLSLDLAPVSGFSSSSSVEVTSDGTLELTLGVVLSDLSAVMRATAPAPANGQLTGDANFTLNLGFSGPVSVTLPSSATLGNTSRADLVADFNDALSAAGLGGDLVAAVDPSGHLTLATLGSALGLAALELRAADFVPRGPASTDPIVTELRFRGQQLAFDSLAQHAFVEGAVIDASASLVAADIDGEAAVGFLGVEVVDGVGTANVDYQLALRSPVTHVVGGRAGIFELYEALATDPTKVADVPTLQGALSATLPLEAELFGSPLITSPSVSLVWSDFTSGGPQVTLNDGEQLLPFENLESSVVSTALGQLADYLASLETVSHWAESIPGLSKSLGEIAGYAEQFEAFAISYDANPALALDQLEATLEGAFGLSDEDLDLSLVESGEVIRADLTLGTQYVKQVPVAVALDSEATQGLGELGHLVDLSGSALLNVDFNVDFQLSFGIDLSSGGLSPFIYETSHLTVAAEVNAQNIEFQASIGPLGLFARHGEFLIDADGSDLTRDAAILDVRLTDNDSQTSKGKVYLSQIDVDNALLSLTGQVHLSLPLYFPFASDFIGRLELEITNLGDIANTTTLTLPDLEKQKEEQEQSGLLSSLTSILHGLDAWFGYTIDAFNGEVAGVELPFVGSDLHKAASFLEEVRDKVISQITDRFHETEGNTGAAIQTALWLAVGPDGLNILKDRNGSGTVTIEDITFTPTDFDQNGKIDQVEFFLDLGQDLTVLDTPFDFNIGLPGLGLEATGNMEILVGYEWDLAFGLSDSYGFYVITTQEDEITVDLEVRIPDLRARGELAFLQIDVVDEDADNNPHNGGQDLDSDGRLPSSFTAGLKIDLQDPGEDPQDPHDNNKLTDAELKKIFLGEIDVDQAIEIDLAGVADVNLDLLVRFAGDSRFPSIGAEFTLDWTFDGSTGEGAQEGLDGGVPTVAFENVTLNAGEFISDFADSVLKQVQKFTEPIQPVVDFVTSPVPLLSSFGFELTPLDIAAALGYATEAEYIEAVADLISVINSVPEVSDQLMIPLGSFVIVEPDGAGGTQSVDLREKRDLTGAMPSVTETKDPATELKNADAEAGDFFDELKEMGILLPMLENPASVFQLLMGQQVDLFIYDIPPLVVNFPFPIVKIGPLIPPIPLFASIGGNIGASLDLAVGFDTHGVEKYQATGDWYDVFAGFYLSDRENADGTGKDVPEATLYGNLNAGAEISLVVVGAGVSGGVDLKLFADLVDPDNDGKVHLDELIANIPLGVTGTFDLSGSITARLDAYVELLFKRINFTIAQFEVTSFEFTDEDIFRDRFTSNNSQESATYLGAGPGLHVDGLGLESLGDEDWFAFDLLRDDSVDVDIRHSNVHGNIDLEVYDASGTLLAEGVSAKDRDIAPLINVPAGRYYARVRGSGRLNNYSLAVEPNASSSTRVIYVNPAGATDRSDSYYTFGPGSDTFDGLNYRKPKATLQGVLDAYELGPNDLVVFDSGTHAAGGILTAADGGATFVGTVAGSRLAGLQLQDYDDGRFHRLTILGNSPSISLTAADRNHFDWMRFEGNEVNLVIDDSDDNVFGHSLFLGAGDGLRIDGDGVNDATGNVVHDSEFRNRGTAVSLQSFELNVLRDNLISDTGNVGVSLPTHSPALLHGNTVGGRAIGVVWESRVADVYDNSIDGNAVGIRSLGGVIGPDNPNPYGTAGGVAPNRVRNNAVGIEIPQEAGGVIVRHTELSANQVAIDAQGDQTQIVANDVHDNLVGIRSSRVVGANNWDANLQNLIHHNDTGVEAQAGAEVRFNRIYANTDGVDVQGTAQVHHNLIYRNSGDGILVSGARVVDLTNNTIVVQGGGGVHLEGFVDQVDMRNNLVSIVGGIGLVVDAEAQFGYTSDYNNYAAAGGAIAWQGKSFADLYDWQVEAESDLNSLGSTVLDPNRDVPQFVDAAGDDFHLLATSTSIDAGDPATDPGLEGAPHGNRINLGAYGGTPQATTSVDEWVRITSPNFYADLPPAHQAQITWESYNLGGGTQLDIDLLEEGVGKVADIAVVSAAAGSVDWTPGDFVSGDNAKRYRVRLTTTSGPALSVQSREPFAVPDFVAASANTFYVNDASTAADSYTTAAGNNRHTGLTPQTPKATLRPLVLSYPMGSGDIVRVDTGGYVHAINLNLAGSALPLDPRMNTVTDTSILGPTGPGQVATIDRANPFAGSTAVELVGAPNMTIRDLTVVGAGIGIRARDASSSLVASDLVLGGHGQDGMSIESLSHDAQLDRLVVSANARHGIVVDSRLVHLRDAAVYDNGEIGVALRSVGGAVLETSEIYQNERGIDVINSGPSKAVIGNLNLDNDLGNLVHDNREEGIFAAGNVLVAGNTVTNNTGYGVRLADGADAHRNVVRDHEVGISAEGSTSDIVENRSFINSVTGIEASLESNVLRNVTYSNDLHGIHTTQFSGIVDHNLVYATGYASMNIEGPGVEAQITHNTVYEPCHINNGVTHSGPTIVATEWDPQILLENFGGPFPPTVTPLWGDLVMQFAPAVNELGDTFDLGFGGGAGALLAEPLPPGSTWTIDYEITALQLSSAMFPPTPLGPVEAFLSIESPSTGQLVLENQNGVLVGTHQMQLSLEFLLPEIGAHLVPAGGPMLLSSSIDPSSQYGELEALQIPLRINPSSLPPEAQLFNLFNPTDAWRWELHFADASGTTEEPVPQHRGDTCAEIGVIVQTQSERVLLRNNAIFVEGDATLGTTVGNSVDLMVAADSTSRWNSDYNALMTDYGAVGMWAGFGAATLEDWQNASHDDGHSLDPPVGRAFIDPDGDDNSLAAAAGYDDNFHLWSPFGQLTQGALAPVADDGPGGDGLPVFLAEIVETTAGDATSVSPLVDGGDPRSDFSLEPTENGNYANLGAYANTQQASITEPEYIHLVYPNGLQQIVEGRTYLVEWRSHNLLPGDDVRIELVRNGGVETLIDPAAPNTGSYLWTVPPGITAATDYRIQITRPSVLNPGTDIEGVSPFDFEVGVDTRRPVVLDTTPHVVELEGSTNADVTSLSLHFSEDLATPAAGLPASYRLKSSGADGVFDESDLSDDVTYALGVVYSAGSSAADGSTVTLTPSGGPLPPGDYRLTALGSALKDVAALGLDGNLTGSASDYVRSFTIDKTSPNVSLPAVTPDPRNGPVVSLTLDFDEPVTGVGVADVRLTRDGGPNLLSGDTTVTTTDGVNWTLENLETITAIEGVYTLEVTAADSQIRDLAGNPLTSGASQSWQVDTTAPSAVVSPILPHHRAAAVDQVTVVFSEPVANFTLADLRLFRDGKAVTLTSQQAPTTTDQVTWTVDNLAALTADDGIYLIKVAAGGGVQDGVGNPLIAEARQAWQMIATSPAVSIVPLSPALRTTDVDEVTVVFDRPVTGVDLSDLQLTRDGSPVSLAGLPQPTSTDGQRWRLTGLADRTQANGDYQIAVNAAGTGIADLAGNLLVQGTSRSWRRDDVAPSVSITPIANSPVRIPIDTLAIVFSKPVTGLDLTELQLTRGGSSVSWTAAQWVDTADGVTWTLHGLAPLTAPDGAYELTLATGNIEAFPGNPLPVGASRMWVQDGTVPSLQLENPTPKARYDSIASVDLSFDEPVTGLELADLVLRHNGTVVPWTGQQSLATSNGEQFTVTGLQPLNQQPGRYELSLAAVPAGVADAAGNLLRVGGFSAWTLLDRADFDGDGRVQGRDFLAWQRGFGLSAGATSADGDADGDMDVDAADLARWEQAFGQTAVIAAQEIPVANPREAARQPSFTSSQLGRSLRPAARGELLTNDGQRAAALDQAFASMSQRQESPARRAREWAELQDFVRESKGTSSTRNQAPDADVDLEDGLLAFSGDA
jgi:hypothetical protein